MKTPILTLIALTAFSIAGEPYKHKTDAVIYEATVNNKKIIVFLPEAPFDPEKHEITPGGVMGQGDDARAFRPKVNGYTTSGFSETDASMMKGVRYLTRLAVSFDGEIARSARQADCTRIYSKHRHDVRFWETGWDGFDLIGRECCCRGFGRR